MTKRRETHKPFDPADPTGAKANAAKLAGTPEPAVVKDYTYLHDRLKPLGWTEENNFFEAKRNATDGSGKEIMAKLPLFDVDETGNILIPYYTVTGAACTYKRGEERWSKDYVLTRLRVPRIDPDGKEIKYMIPKGAGTFPWIPPNVMHCYREAFPIDTLVLTEGAIKAWSGYIRGLYIIGLTSISHYKDRAIETLHHDIVEVIKRCKTKNLVWLVDGDAKSLTKDWQAVIAAEAEGGEKKELPQLDKKPRLFFSSAERIRELTKDYGCDIYFANIHSESVPGNPKGLDDLFLAYREIKGNEAEKTARDLVPTHQRGKKLTEAAFAKELKKAEPGIRLAREKAMADADAEVVHDITSYSAGSPRFIHRLNITASTSRLRTYFGLSNEEQFYQTYAHLIGEREFNYRGSHYQWNADKGTLELKLAAATKDYALVGDNFYQYVQIPRKLRDGKLIVERVLKGRLMGTITRKHGRAFINHIPQFNDFCNIPNHRDYQPVHHACLNLYHPFEHKAEEGECKETLDFLEHIAGSGTITSTHPITREKYQVKELDVFLDYLQLMFEKPTQILPIFCPVSAERNTGKSTLLKWLKHIYTQNAVFVGNADFDNDFNALWGTRNLVMCEESFIDKKKVIERVKTLSTADRISINAKGKDQVEVDFFAKFILASNNEDNFATVDDKEVRFWVRKIPIIEEGRILVGLQTVMREQIPQFIHFLQNRKKVTEELYRHWFDPKLLMTDALRKVMEHSKPGAIKEIHMYMRELFFRTQFTEILMDADDIWHWVFGRSTSKDRTYLNRLITEDLKIDRYRRDGRQVTKSYEFPATENRRDPSTGKWERKEINVSGNGRPFVFRREDFISNEEWAGHQFDSEVFNPNALPKPPVVPIAATTEEEDMLFGERRDQ